MFLRSKKATGVEKAIGYVFKDRSLLTNSLTHSSARAAAQPRSDYERLEFLGDRVLGLAVAEMVSQVYPEASEGDLARRFNRLVRGGTCALIGGQIGLGAQLVLSDSEAVHGGRGKETILADAMEA
ncbi:MAG: ribonuclease III domain-containing protein, partial [Hyphomicrobiaceae bacterium]